MDTYANYRRFRTTTDSSTVTSIVTIRRFRSAGDARGARPTLSCCQPTPNLGSTCIWCSPDGNGVVIPRLPRVRRGPPIRPEGYPTVASGGPEITAPRIDSEARRRLRGRQGGTPEFDYPRGTTTSPNYSAPTAFPSAGSPGGRRRRYSDDANTLLSRYITGESRIMLHRNIQDRVQTIAPFLHLDREPYAVINGGRLDARRLHHERLVSHSSRNPTAATSITSAIQ